MSNKDRVYVEVFHRDEHSLGANNRQRYGAAIYHWAILIAPKAMSRGADCTSFDVTDGVRQVGRTNLNPNRDWWFRSRYNANPLRSGHFLGAVMIGKVPEGTSVQQIQAVLERVSIPQRGQTPEQNCVTWVQWAIEALQTAGLAEEKDPGKFMRTALKFGDRIIRKGGSGDWKKRSVNGMGRPM